MPPLDQKLWLVKVTGTNDYGDASVSSPQAFYGTLTLGKGNTHRESLLIRQYSHIVTTHEDLDFGVEDLIFYGPSPPATPATDRSNSFVIGKYSRFRMKGTNHGFLIRITSAD